MEEMLCTTSSVKIQNENLSQNVEGEDVLNSVFSSKNISPVEDKNLDKFKTKVKEETNLEVSSTVNNDSEIPVNGESTETCELVVQKTFSPTLIESAFKVMKNLFSPDKTKSKSVSVVNAINQPLNSISPCSSIYISSKTELFSSEPEAEILSKVQSTPGENSFKNHLQNENLEVIQSPLTLDPLNNTDESFLTTVSLIDESFHSAITHFDELGESLKNGTNLMENILSNSQNLDLMDSYNDTIENNESCLENTTLKIGSFTSKGNKLNNALNQNKDGSKEALNSSEISIEISNLNGSERVPIIQVQFDELPENQSNSSPRSENELKSHDGILTKSNSERENSQDVDDQEMINADDLPAICYNGKKSSCEVVEMSHLILCKSFEKQLSKNENNGKCPNTNAVEEGKEKFNEIDLENEIRFGPSNYERDFTVEDSISTTTIVLRTVDSVDIDNMLMSLKADDSETNTSSLTSFDSDDATSSQENVTGKMSIKEIESMPVIQFSDSNSYASENFFSLTDDKKTCASEMNSSNNKPDAFKIKFNKSDKLINRKIPNESSEKKRISHEEKESSVDILLMKNSEASEISKELYPHADVEVTQTFKKHFTQSDISKDQDSLLCGDPVTVISQQSYTILTTHDNSLNRPVIEPLKSGRFETQTFQLNQSNATPTPESGNLEKLSLNNCSNTSFGTDELVKSSQLKQSTPLLEKHNESTQKFFRPSSLKLNSPDLKEFSHICEDKNDVEKNSSYIKSDLVIKVEQIFSHEEGQIEFSPVNPVSDNELVFSNSTENERGENSYNQCSTKILESRNPKELNQDLVKQLGPNESKKSPDNFIHSLNLSSEKKRSPEPNDVKQTVCKSPDSKISSRFTQTFEKKPKLSSKNQSSDSRRHNKLNSSFDKRPNSPKKNFTKKTGTPEFEKANQTFTKKTGLPEIISNNRTYDRPGTPKSDKLNTTYDKSPGNKELNRTFDRKTDCRELQILNLTFDKKSGSLPPCEKTQIIEKASPDGNENNQTFCKETDFSNTCREKEAQGINKMNECIDIAGITKIKERKISMESEVKVQNLLTEENITLEKRTPMFDALSSISNENETECRNSNFLPPDSVDGTNKNFALGNYKDINDSFVSTRSSSISLGCSDLSTVLLNEDEFLGNQSIDDLSEKVGKMSLNENSKQAPETQFEATSRAFPENILVAENPEIEQNFQTEEKLTSSLKDEKLPCDTDIIQLIQEQFSVTDIEKICNVAQELSSMKLGSDVLKTSELFDKSFQENLSDAGNGYSEIETKSKTVNALSPNSFDFLNSIRGKPTGRDLSRESLYVKFDPLVQPSANSLIDFTKEGEELSAVDVLPASSHSTSVCEQLLTISPQKKSGDIVPPLTPLSDKMKTITKEDKTEKLKELQNEIYFLKNLYAERERSNKAKIDDYESQIAKLTGESCILEDKLKESSEREKSLVKKMKEQTQSIGQLQIIMEEYVKVISKLTAELETVKKENQKQIETLSLEKDSYMTHLQNTEAAFTDVHTKYEKSKKTIMSLKANEAMYRNTIAEQTQKLEEFKVKAKEAQEKAFSEFQKIQEQLNETKVNHTQEAARLRALLKKTELKIEALQESLDQKLKENQQLTAICDELIEGKK